MRMKQKNCRNKLKIEFMKNSGSFEIKWVKNRISPHDSEVKLLKIEFHLQILS